VDANGSTPDEHATTAVNTATTISAVPGCRAKKRRITTFPATSAQNCRRSGRGAGLSDHGSVSRSSDEIDWAALSRRDVARIDVGSGRGEELLVEVAEPP
jgi:hypothetical protein